MALEDTITVCADCGATITQYPAGSGRWARVTVHDEELSSARWAEQRSRTYEFCCRVVYDTSSEPPYRVLRADYHHPAWANQRHFAPKEGLA